MVSLFSCLVPEKFLKDDWFTMPYFYDLSAYIAYVPLLADHMF